MRKQNIMGLSYDMYTENETVAIISDFIDSSNGGIICRSDLNVSTIVTAQTDSFIKGFINSSDIVNIDGMGVILGGKFLNKPLPQRIAGADLFERLLNVSDKKGYSVYFLGATQEVVESTACKAKKEYPNLVISGFHDGYFGTEQEKVVDEINRCAPDMLFIGTKSPDKELFIAKYKADLNVKFVMGVGGTFDVYSGALTRAPNWVQKLGMEWLFRLCQEPKRMWRRYLTSNSIFAKLLVLEKVKLLNFFRWIK